MEPQDILKLTPFFGAVHDQSELDLLAGSLRVASFPRGTMLGRTEIAARMTAFYRS